jgi:hypothetical protein
LPLPFLDLSIVLIRSTARIHSFSVPLSSQVERFTQGILQCHPNACEYSDPALEGLHTAFFLGLQPNPRMGPDGPKSADLRPAVNAFKPQVYEWQGRKEGMEMAISRAKRRQLPAWVFPNGVRPERAPKKRPSLDAAPGAAAPTGDGVQNGAPGAKAAKTGEEQTAGEQSRALEREGVAEEKAEVSGGGAEAPSEAKVPSEASPNGMEVASPSEPAPEAVSEAQAMPDDGEGAKGMELGTPGVGVEKGAEPEAQAGEAEKDSEAEAQAGGEEKGLEPETQGGEGEAPSEPEIHEAVKGVGDTSVNDDKTDAVPAVQNGHADAVAGRREPSGDGGVEELEVLYRAHGASWTSDLVASHALRALSSFCALCPLVFKGTYP